MFESKFMSPNSYHLFEAFCASRKLALKTKKEYLSEISHLLDFAQADLLAITHGQMDAYLLHLKKRVEKGQLVYETLAKKVKMLKSVYSFITLEAADDRLPTGFVNPLSMIDVDEPRYFYVEEDLCSYKDLNTFFNYVYTRSLRDYIFYQLTFFTLLKPSILIKLYKEQFVEYEGDYYIRVIGKKNSPKRDIKIPYDLAKLIEAHIDGLHTSHVFVSRLGKPLSIRSLQKNTATYTAELKFPPGYFTPTRLYHSGIYFALRDSKTAPAMPKDELVRQLGITDESFLDRYVMAKSSDIDASESSCDYINIVSITEKEVLNENNS